MHTVELRLQDNVYRAAQQAADSQGRAVEELLVDTLTQEYAQEGIADPSQDPMDLEEAAFEAMRDSLWQQYPNQYVAIQHGVVIDHDADKYTLFQRVRAGRPVEEVVLLKQVTAEPKPPIRWRSDWRLER